APRRERQRWAGAATFRCSGSVFPPRRVPLSVARRARRSVVDRRRDRSPVRLSERDCPSAYALERHSFSARRPIAGGCLGAGPNPVKKPIPLVAQVFRGLKTGKLASPSRFTWGTRSTSHSRDWRLAASTSCLLS